MQYILSHWQQPTVGGGRRHPVSCIPNKHLNIYYVLCQGSFDLYGAVALGQASPCLHDVAASFPVLPAARASAALLPQDLPSPETTQVTELYFVPRKLLSQQICRRSLWQLLFSVLFRAAVFLIMSLCLRSAAVFQSDSPDNGPHAVSHRDMLERSRRTRGAQRINVMLLAIVVAFALCWLPLNVFNTLFDWHHQALPDCQHDAIFSACHLTAMASTCINPVVYGFLNSNFQKELKATLQRCQCSNRTTESYESFPLSTVGSEGLTKATSINRMGSVCVLSARPEVSTAIPVKTIPGNTEER